MSMWLRIRRCLWVRWFEHKLKRGRKRQCKAVGYNCAECVYHEFLHDSILPRSLFGIESDFVSKNPTLVRLYTAAARKAPARP